MEPQINADERRLNTYSEKIIGAAFEVSNVLGAGFLEKVYENALSLELNLNGLKTIQQAPLKVFYKNKSAFICVRIYNILARVIKHSCTYIKVGREGNKHCVWDPFP